MHMQGHVNIHIYVYVYTHYVHLHMYLYMHIWTYIPGPPKEPKIMAQYPKIESIGSIGSILLGSFGGPGTYICISMHIHILENNVPQGLARPAGVGAWQNCWAPRCDLEQTSAGGSGFSGVLDRSYIIMYT